MKPEDRQQYIDMIDRVFIRAVRDPHGNEEYELSEGEATKILMERENRASRLSLEAILLIANVSEDRLAKVYDAVTKARDLIHPWLESGSAQGEALQAAFQLLQDAKYGLGGRTNVAASIRVALGGTGPMTEGA